MSTSRIITRLAAVTALGLVLAGTVAAPAFAEDVVGVSLSGMPSSFTAGARADSFTVGLRNNTNNLVSGVTVAFSVQLNGLTADQVRIHGAGGDLTARDEGGQVVASDPHSHDFFGRVGRTEIAYSIEFLAGAPSGRAGFTANAVQQGRILGSASTSINVKGGAVAPSPTASAFPTDSAAPGDSAIVPPVSPGATGALANPTNAPQDNSGGIPVGLYIMGGLLVGVGGVILWMLFRQRPQAAPSAVVPGGPFPTGDYPTGEFDSPPPSLGYPVGRASASLPPTAALPALRGSTVIGPGPMEPSGGKGAPDGDQLPRRTPPPADPWGTPGGNRPRHGAD
jgi:hypothetical protein